MKSLGKVLATIVLCGAGAGYASAATNNVRHNREWRARHSIDARQENQQDRIAQGINNGSLTSREASRLEREQARINKQEARLRQGGLTSRERGRLEDEQDRLSRQIYREKHDAQTQPK